LSESGPPEINLAKRLVRVKKLQPPINVFKLASTYAEVIEKNFPVDADGVCLDLKRPGRRPKIVVNLDRSETRRRFTLAHELGHVLIPWHVGSLVDQTDLSDYDSSSSYWQWEGEANRFASELLMPADWVKHCASKSSDPSATMRSIASHAKTSPQAAALKLCGCLGPGYVFAQCTEGLVTLSARSPGTIANKPSSGSPAAFRQTLDWAPFNWQIEIGSSVFRWWRFTDDVAPIALDVPADWRALLEEILSDTGVKPDEMQKTKEMVNGVIGYANGSIRGRRSIEAIYSACKQRFHSKSADDPRIRRIIKHELFETYLSARVSEFPI
jgi:hypothetical protein